MHHVVIIETAHHVHDRIHRTDMPQELISQPLACAGPLHQPSDIDKLDGGVLAFLGFHDDGKLVNTRVRHLHNPHIRVDGTERVVGRFGSGTGDGVKDGGFAHIGQTDNTAIETHGPLSFQILLVVVETHRLGDTFVKGCFQHFKGAIQHFGKAFHLHGGETAQDMVGDLAL